MLEDTDPYAACMYLYLGRNMYTYEYEESKSISARFPDKEYHRRQLQTEKG